MYRKKRVYFQITIALFLAFITTLSITLITIAESSNSNKEIILDSSTSTIKQPSLNLSNIDSLQLDFTRVSTVYLPLIINLPIISDPIDPDRPLTSCNPTHGSGGLAPGRYDTVIRGLQAIVVVGKEYHPDKPTYLTFHIHGDGGNYDKFDKNSNPVTKLVNERNWILVSPLAPNGFSWWQDQVGDHRQAFADVLEEMFRRYNVCRNIILGSTGSGGSEFWTRMFFPQKGGDYPSHTVISCGGNDANGNDREKIKVLGQNPDIVARSTFYFVYGTEDSLVPLIEDSIEMYSQAGFNVETEVIEGADHCNKWKDAGLMTQDEHIAEKWIRFAEALLIDDTPAIGEPISGLIAGNDSPTTLGNLTALSATIISGTNVSYSWNLGDNNTAIGNSPSHGYGAVGAYTATVTATNILGSEVATTIVTIQNITPTAAFTLTPGLVEATTTFTNESSGTNLEYLWDFGDGSTVTDVNPSHVYTAANTYTVQLIATNSVGSSSFSRQIVIEDAPISGLSADNNSPTIQGDETELFVTIISGTNVIYNWDLGDGMMQGNAGITLTYIYPTTGTFTATVMAVNSVSSGTVTTVVTVE